MCSDRGPIALDWASWGALYKEDNERVELELMLSWQNWSSVPIGNCQGWTEFRYSSKNWAEWRELWTVNSVPPQPWLFLVLLDKLSSYTNRDTVITFVLFRRFAHATLFWLWFRRGQQLNIRDATNFHRGTTIQIWIMSILAQSCI